MKPFRFMDILKQVLICGKKAAQGVRHAPKETGTWWKKYRGTKETKELHSAGGSLYSAQRRAIHIKIVKNILVQAGSSRKGQQPVVVLIGGGTASGKTALRKAVIEKELAKRGIKAGTVDADEIKEMIPEYETLKKTDPKNAACLVHKESCDIAALLLDQLIKNRMHFIYEGTMARTKNCVKLVERLKKAGYEVHAYIVDVPVEIAKQRSDERAKRTGRKVPHHIFENTHRLVPKTVEAIKDKVDSWQIYDNQNQFRAYCF